MSLFANLSSTANTLRAFQQALTVTQNNVANASTPGYASQRQTLSAEPFDPSTGLVGGVTAGEVQSSRDQFAESYVRNSNSQWGASDQKTQSLSYLQTNFDISGTSGIVGALTSLYNGFSNWSVTPNDATARQNVIANAQSTADAFRQTVANVAAFSRNTDAEIGSTVDQANALVDKLRQLNVTIKNGAANDPSVDASVNSALESLSEMMNVTALRQSDGSVDVYLNGQTALLAGASQYPLSVRTSIPASPTPVYPSGTPQSDIVNANGQPVTDQVTGGRLAGLLDVRNRVLPSIQGDAYQEGSLNKLAASFADRVNQLLTGGVVSDGPSPQPGQPLFSYDAANAAATLEVNPSLDASQLAAIDPGPPTRSNGVALDLAALSNPAGAEGRVDGQSYAAFYGSIAASVGSELSNAQTSQAADSNVLSQARALREQSSGVSLDDEAVHVLEFQRSYEAAAKMMGVVDELTQTVIGLIG